MPKCPPVAGVRAFTVVWLRRVVRRRDGNDPNGAGAFRERDFFFLSTILLGFFFVFLVSSLISSNFSFFSVFSLLAA